jgi:rhodanese-related sulfurtransferase
MTATKPPRATYRGEPVDAVVDVRSKLEFWLGHLDGAVCIPVDVIASRLAEHPEITKDARILVYCASGGRSAAAAAELKALGYTRVTDGGAMATAATKYSP